MIQKYWKDFLEHTSRDHNTKCSGAVCFGMDAHACEAAVEKVLSGEMTCRIYPADGYRKAMNGEAQAGELNIVVDWKGVPRAVIETTKVRRMPVDELTDEICAMEGMQPDLRCWREKQLPYIKTEVEELGGVFDEAAVVSVEEFKTVYSFA